ncbi:MAG: RDD family protein [Thermoanaerobaculia bacterium]|nr:RDD family protein [Thermoanaerobaculia bacterium]
MTRSRGPLEQSSLFDLELDSAETVDETSEAEEWVDAAEADTLSTSAAIEEAVGPFRASGVSLLYAACVDGTVNLAVLLVAVVGLRLLQVPVGLGALPGLALMILVFSFFYFVIPLAFWGNTLGMRLAGLISRGDEGQALSLGQAFSRWLGALITVACATLPLLLLVTERSLADRLSASTTWERPPQAG